MLHLVSMDSVTSCEQCLPQDSVWVTSVVTEAGQRVTKCQPEDEVLEPQAKTLQPSTSRMT